MPRQSPAMPIARRSSGSARKPRRWQRSRRLPERLADRQPAIRRKFRPSGFYRNLSEAVILNAAPNGAIQSLVLVNPYDRPLDRVVTPEVLAELKQPTDSVPLQSSDRIGAVSRLSDRRFHLHLRRPRVRSADDQSAQSGRGGGGRAYRSLARAFADIAVSVQRGPVPGLAADRRAAIWIALGWPTAW